jgi:hypothetical protein
MGGFRPGFDVEPPVSLLNPVLGQDSAEWPHSDLDPFVQSRGNAPGHRQGMALIVGVPKAANDRGGGADLPGERTLA